MKRINLAETANTAKYMTLGALTLVLAFATFWIAANFDVMIKAIKYPEAVRKMQIEVRVSQPE